MAWSRWLVPWLAICTGGPCCHRADQKLLVVPLTLVVPSSSVFLVLQRTQRSSIAAIGHAVSVFFAMVKGPLLAGCRW
jgi:hypothetical protein